MPRTRFQRPIAPAAGAVLLSFLMLLDVFAASAGGRGVKLREGTEVHLVFSEEVSSKTAVEDDSVSFRLDEDLVVDGVVVARRGTLAVGVVSHAKKAGMLGAPGELAVRVSYLKVGDRRVRLRGKKAREGENKVGTAVAIAVLLSPVGLVKRGKNCVVSEGTAITAFVDEDTILPPAAAPAER